MMPRRNAAVGGRTQGRRRKHIREGQALPTPSRADTGITRLSGPERMPWSFPEGLVVVGLGVALLSKWDLALIANLALRLGHPADFRHDLFLRELAELVQELFVLACVVGVLFRKYHLTWWQFGFRGLPRYWQYLVLAGFLGSFLTETVYQDVVRLLPWSALRPSPNFPLALFSDSPLLAMFSFVRGSSLVPFVSVVLCIGLVFQGTIGRRLVWKHPLGTLDLTIGPWTAALASALLLATLGWQVGLLIPFTIVGVIYAWVYLSSGSLWTVVYCEAAWNAYALWRAMLHF